MKFIYIHINKCGGTSLTQALKPFLTHEDIVLGGFPEAEKRSEEYFKKYGIYKHSTASEIKKFVGSDVWNEYYKFATIRDPWDRVVSTYFWFHKTGWKGYGKGDKVRSMSFEEYALSSLMDEKTCTDFLYDEQGNLIVDEYYNISDLKSLIDVLKNKFNLNGLTLERKNSTSHRDYFQYYSSHQIRARIASYFSKDLINFGFDFPLDNTKKNEDFVDLIYKYKLFESALEILSSGVWKDGFYFWFKILSEAAVRFNDIDYLDFLCQLPSLGQSHHTYSAIPAGERFFRHINLTDNSKINDVCVQVISLKNSSRKLKFFENWKINIPFNFFEAVDASHPDFEPENYVEYNGHFNESPTVSDLGHLGCSLSHFQVWKYFVDTVNKPYLLVLEDDAVSFGYSQKLLNWILDGIPDEADIVLLNGRSVEKLYSTVSANPPYEGFPEIRLHSRSEAVSIMSENYNKLRPYGGGGKAHWNGTDGYLLTKRGAEKALKFVSKYGLPPFGPTGGDTNIDMLLGLLTLGKKDFRGKPAGFNYKRAEELNIFFDNSILNAYVSPFPLVDEMDRLGILVGSDIVDNRRITSHVTDDDAFFLKELAIQYERKDLNIAIKLMSLALKGRPTGPVIKSKLEQYKAKLNK